VADDLAISATASRRRGARRRATAATPPRTWRSCEAIWTLDPGAARRASRTAAALAGAIDPPTGARLEALLADRPLALEQPVPALTALANRVVAYLER
jgi:hypothetical protein